MMGFQYESPFQGVHFQVSCWFFVCVFVSAVPCLVVDTGLESRLIYAELWQDRCVQQPFAGSTGFFPCFISGGGGIFVRSSHGLWSKHRWLRTNFSQWKGHITWWRGWRGRGWCEKQQRCIESQSRRTIELKGAMTGSMGISWGSEIVWNCNNKVTTWMGLEKISVCPWFLLKVVFFCFGDPKICFYWFWFLRDV